MRDYSNQGCRSGAYLYFSLGLRAAQEEKAAGELEPSGVENVGSADHSEQNGARTE